MMLPRIVLRFTIVAAISCCSYPISALDLLESYQAALLEDAEYQAARALADEGREAVPMARAQLFPSITFNATRFDNALITETQDALGRPRTYDQQYGSKNYSLSLRQALYRPQQFAGYLQAKSRVEGVEAQLDKAGQDLAVRVTAAYSSALLAEEILRQVEAQRVAIEAQLESAQRALKLGHGTRTDIDDAQARLDMNRSKILGARQGIDQTRHELEILINRPAVGLRPLDMQQLELLPLVPNSLSDWIERAEVASPDLRDMQARIEAARHEVSRVRAGHKPTLDLIVQRSISDSDSVSSIGNRHDNSQVGMQLSIPIFAGGYVSAQVRQAQAALEGHVSRYEAQRRKLAAQVRKEFQGVDEGILKIRALEQALRSAEQSAISNRRGFEAGTRTRIDILNAEENRSNVSLELQRERLLFIMSRARLLALCGALDHGALALMNRWLAH